MRPTREICPGISPDDVEIGEIGLEISGDDAVGAGQPQPAAAGADS